MELSEYTLEELRGEISRRAKLKKEEQAKVKRCRMCKYHGTITYYGAPIEKKMAYDNCCPFQTYLYKKTNSIHYRSMNPSAKACDKFEEKEA